LIWAQRDARGAAGYRQGRLTMDELLRENKKSTFHLPPCRGLRRVQGRHAIGVRSTSGVLGTAKGLMNHTDAEQIHEASLALLADPGVRIEHDGICERLRQAGARPGAAAQVIRFPEGLVAECLAAAPEEVLLADRRGGGTVLSSGSRTSVWSVPGMHLLRQRQHRRFASGDMADWARLLDQLPGVDGVFGLAMSDVPPTACDVVGLRIMAENTTKHIRVLCFTPRGAAALRAMQRVLRPAPWFSVGFTAHGPLRWTNLALSVFEQSAGSGIPVTINGEPMAGATAPVTLAGAAAVGNAEILAGLVVNQLLEPGRPCIYNLGLAHVFDMRTAIAVTGAPENHLLADIAAGMGRFYGLPSCSWVSTDAMSPDAQAAIEKSIGFLSHFQSGVSLIWGVGQLESQMTVSPAQAVIDDEILAYVRRYVRGVAVNAQTLAVDVTRDVGIAGDFLAAEHTAAHFREELFQPTLLWRKRRDAWSRAGNPPLSQVAEERAERLMAAPRPPLLTAEQAAELRHIEQEFLGCQVPAA
jgi:trimethylamine--corrinoid protein Co-methyltransferase